MTITLILHSTSGICATKNIYLKSNPLHIDHFSKCIGEVGGKVNGKAADAFLLHLNPDQVPAQVLI